MMTQSVKAYDKAARTLGFPLSRQGCIWIGPRQGKSGGVQLALPRPVVDGCPYDFSFSGLKLRWSTWFTMPPRKGRAFGERPCRLVSANGLQHPSPRLMRAAEEYGYKTIVLAGGVSANSVLRR